MHIKKFINDNTRKAIIHAKIFLGSENIKNAGL